MTPASPLAERSVSVPVTIFMPRNKIDFDTVRRMALSLPDVEESTTYGSPALKVRGKLLTCIAVHKSAEPDSLAVRIDFEHRAELMAAPWTCTT